MHDTKPLSAPEDTAAREAALNIRGSFIVRAPAGSGKTRLLIQRFLRLLAVVDEPEEIVAITFTRKAASEMRLRLMAALSKAGHAEGDAFEADAMRALERDRVRGWGLCDNPSRLRIQTIDSLNASLTRQMPVLSRFGAQPAAAEDARPLYLAAAREVVAMLEGTDRVAAHVATLLVALDNNRERVESLIADMLAARDHWLRNLSSLKARPALERGLRAARIAAVCAAQDTFPVHLRSETRDLVSFSGQNHPKTPVEWTLSGLRALDHVPVQAMQDEEPEAMRDAMEAWRALADLLLTQDDTWRSPRGINKNLGFPLAKDLPPPRREEADAMKSRMKALLEELADPAYEDVRAALADIRLAPPAAYGDDEWRVLEAIVGVLPMATAHLWQVFGQRGQSDFTEIALAASRALGSEDEPTDLALALDYRLTHLLVDEFQDTSYAQFALLQKLTRGWNPDDGRTLFLVGDPMQSIYRFREAEVALFMRAWHEGIGDIALTPVTLSVNFRSMPKVIDWVNRTFSQLMPAEVEGIDRSNAAQVPYAESIAHGSYTTHEQAGTGVTLHWLAADAPQIDRVREAEQVRDAIRQMRARMPDARIAVLVRNRSHLASVLPVLRAADIAYTAVDIDPLATRPAVTDVLALARALLFPTDRVAWLTLLRAPWCGLGLHDLAALTGTRHPVETVDGSLFLAADARPLVVCLRDESRLAQLTEDGRRRASHVMSMLADGLSDVRRMPLRDVVEQAWRRLNGPATLASAAELADVDAFLQLLHDEAMEQSGGQSISDLARLEARLQTLYAVPLQHDGAVPPIEVMTIHKAKGLEWDGVLVPGLARTPKADGRRLLTWHERVDATEGMPVLLVAPIGEEGMADERRADAEVDAIYRHIRHHEASRQRAEERRLVYVAATRAIRELHLFATVRVDDDGLRPSPSSSLAAGLWPAHAADAAAVLGNQVQEQASASTLPLSVNATGRKTPQRLTRLFDPGVHEPASRQTGAADTAALPEIDFDWAGDGARIIGTVTHRFLQRIAEDGVTGDPVPASLSLISRELIREGLSSDATGIINSAAARIADALAATMRDQRGQWLLSPHAGARTEWRLSGYIDGAAVDIAIDRTFIDESGTRWVIDYKSGQHDGAGREAFLDAEVSRYRPQLARYATLVRAWDATHGGERPIRVALYFPMMQAWREWSAV